MRLLLGRLIRLLRRVSIHAPWEGCDVSDVGLRERDVFQFTHPGKGATPYDKRTTRSSACFNSRTLGRVRHRCTHRLSYAFLFQFTHPGKGATVCWLVVVSKDVVSIHAPWEGCDIDGGAVKKNFLGFNSRTLGRVRRGGGDEARLSLVSIHAPWEGCDTAGRRSHVSKLRFQFTHPGKGATRRRDEACTHALRGFNSRTLGRVRHGRAVQTAS